MKKKSVQIVAVVLMLAGMVIYLLTLDLSEEPEPESVEEFGSALPVGADE